jgi:hypothetical protein
MKYWFHPIIACVITAVGLLATQPARAQITITYNNTVTAINGTGNPNGFWNSYLNTGLNLQLSLRAQTTIFGTVPTSPNNAAGTFTFPAGTKPASTQSTWDYWFSINTNPSGAGANNLNAYDFYLTFDTPTAPGTFRTPINVLTAIADNAYGKNATANGAGTIGTSATSPSLVLNNNIAQNAENISFSGLPTSVTGNYNFELYAVAAGAGANGTRLGEADMIVNVSPVPEPSILAMTGLGFFGLLMFGRGQKL